ncbi:ImmA/IrrE family metallo-endopeptidase [Seleniivibrio woodruffii]|uniref:Uncharacterized protein DUF955 n=1 Tax=Seleniivibrio woodruffii TaxID=1078050 RepID=A0A4R1K747_9BACT|nr:ImmA/IrrE family metallo-endopeptidase [Seleniivibrio woodruffii]TCK59840.1 uncharacterized protein DUF955 [Seleniivibrio woodruffii]TVZ35939.1 uncharacterized protein DUF955 [Seleniivibrio woodruffii]
MNNMAREAIGNLTTYLLDYYYNGKISFPLNIEEMIINKLQGRIEPDATLDMFIDAKIVKSSSNNNHKFTIFINPNLPQTRKNFTLAHELGHLFLHMGFMIDNAKWEAAPEYIDGAFARNQYDTGENENQAHEFAGSLLMPAEQYKQFVRDNAINNQIDVQGIANYFGVSYDAALVRGKWLGVFNW